MDGRIFNILPGRPFYKGMWYSLVVLLLGITLVPHHHHTHEDLCLRMDWAHHHADSYPSSGGCDNCCVARFVSYRQHKAEPAKTKPIFLLSLFASFFLFGVHRARISMAQVLWRVREGAFVPDDDHSTSFGWRAPPIIHSL